MAKARKPKPTKKGDKERTLNAPQATQLLRDDHRRMESFFDAMDETDDLLEKTEIRDNAIAEVRVHKAVVEEVFYPVAGEALEESLVDEAREELEELEPLLETVETTSPGDSSFESAWQKLSRQLAHHIKWEEQELLNKAEETEELNLQRLGLRMTELRKEIIAEQPMVSWETEDSDAEPEDA